MSQRNSGYARKANDFYSTPAWCTEVIIPHLPPAKKILEPACGDGAMVRVLADAGYHVHASDLVDGEDFLIDNDHHGADGIVSNPAYSDVNAFVQHAIDVMMLRNGFVALLLPANFDSAKSRRHLFADCPMFAKTVVLTKRIVWFERSDGKQAAPSENHRWFLWSWRHKGPPTIGYAP